MKSKNNETGNNGAARNSRDSKSTFKKVWNVVSIVFVVLVALMALALVGARIFGLRVFSVLSGSMEPEYYTGDLIYVKPVDPETVEVGDDITFVLNKDLVVGTHRVIRIDRETCIGCQSCESRCPFGVPVAERMKKTADLFGC